MSELRERILAKVEPDLFGGCWLWTGGVREAQPRRGKGLRPILSYRGKSTTTARLAYMAWRGAIPAGLLVCHRCDVPACVNPDHLFLGTNADNSADMKAKGRAKGHPQRGDKNHQAKLTASDVAAIKRRIADGERNVDIALDYGVSPANISGIRRGVTWGDG